VYYPCAKLGDFCFSHFSSNVRTNRHKRDADERLTPATLVGVTNNKVVARIEAVYLTGRRLFRKHVLLMLACRRWSAAGAPASARHSPTERSGAVAYVTTAKSSSSTSLS